MPAESGRCLAKPRRQIAGDTWSLSRESTCGRGGPPRPMSGTVRRWYDPDQSFGKPTTNEPAGRHNGATRHLTTAKYRGCFDYGILRPLARTCQTHAKLWPRPPGTSPVRGGCSGTRSGFSSVCTQSPQGDAGHASEMSERPRWCLSAAAWQSHGGRWREPEPNRRQDTRSE